MFYKRKTTAHKAGRKIKAYNAGLKAERYAALYLRLKGYRILKQRYKTPVGEVDIIAQRGNVLAFIEVKARRTMDEALYAVDERTQRRIEKAAGHFMIYNPSHADAMMRFDVIAFTLRGEDRSAGLFSNALKSWIVGGIFPKHLDNAWEGHS